MKDDHKANILLVDDRPENLLTLEAILEPLGQNLVRAASGLEALKQLLTQEFAVILLDVQMPGIDGFETAALIKEREKSRHIPIIFVTAISKDEHYVFRGYSVGAVDYIRKPFDPDILRSKVAVFVDLFKKAEQIKRQAALLRQSEQREAERERVEAELALERCHLAQLAQREAQLRQFKATLDATLDAVFMYDPESLRFAYVNQGALSQLGYTRDELLTMTTVDIIPEYDEPRYREMLAPLREGKQTAHTFETLHRRKDGTQIPVEVSLQFIAPPGETGRFVSIVRDITERRQAQEALKQSEALLSGIIGAAMDAILTVDERQRITGFNAAAERMFGYTADEIRGQPLALLLPERFHAAHARHILNFGASSTTSRSMGALGVLLGRRKNGEEFPIEATISQVAVGGQRLFTAIVRDITERKRAEAALATAFERERRIARTLQSTLLLEPPEDSFPGLAIATFYEAAWDEASFGGDFFDAFALSEGKVALVVGDVAGKGLAAAARTGEVKYALRAFLRESPDPARAVARLNGVLCDTQRLDHGDFGAFICLSLVVVDTAGEETVFVVAGGEPPLLLRGGGGSQTVEATGMPVGIDPKEQYAASRLRLAPEDTILLLTDGVTEARRGSGFFGYEGVRQRALQAAPPGSLRQIGQAVLEAARGFAGGKLQDDACLLLVRRQAERGHRKGRE